MCVTAKHTKFVVGCYGDRIVDAVKGAAGNDLPKRGNLRMVWGLVDPNGFGDFFPYGDEVGYDEQMKRCTEILFSDELQAEIARRGLRIPRHHQLRAV